MKVVIGRHARRSAAEMRNHAWIMEDFAGYQFHKHHGDRYWAAVSLRLYLKSRRQVGA